MLSISASGSVSQPYFQSVCNTSPTQTTQPTVTPDNPTDDPQGGASPVQGRHHHHHGGGQLFAKIRSAVTSALQSAQSDPSADPNQAIESAIAQVLDNSGGNSDPSSAAGAVPGAPDPSAGAQVAPTGDSGNSQQSFVQLLQSLGVNAQQFHQDFLAALTDARKGTVDPSTAFQSVPPGTILDTLG